MAKLGRSLPLLPLLRSAFSFALSGVIYRSTSCAALALPSQRPSYFGHYSKAKAAGGFPIYRRVKQLAHSHMASDDAAAKTSLYHQNVSAVHAATSPIGFYEEEIMTRQTQAEAKTNRSPFGFTLQSLSYELEGSGRAAVVWDCLRAGIDPNLYYSSPDEKDISDDPIARAWIAAASSSASTSTSQHAEIPSVYHDGNILGRRHGQGLGTAAWKRLQKIMHDYQCSNDDLLQLFGNKDMRQQRRETEVIYTIENSIAFLSHLKVSSDGTTKLLLKMKKDGLEVESVIIPWVEKGFSTLCVSSQVGCKQGCTFCATGRMGKVRSLKTDEILVQVYYARKVCRVISKIQNNNEYGIVLPKVDNIVFMGMGEPADNAAAVVLAVNTLVDRRMFGLTQSKVTISTVAPDPSAFASLGRAPASLAWSVHAVDDSLRRRLVPSTKYSMEELKKSLVQALSSRSNKLRRTMLEVALIEGVNDSNEDAERLAKFSQSIMDKVAGSKVVVNLIPYNAIDHPTYRTPSVERVLEFQKSVTESGVLCYVRTTRGDEESSACGQLATKKKKNI